MGIRAVATRGAGKSSILGPILAWNDFLTNKPTIVFDPNGGAIDGFMRKFLQLPKSQRKKLAKRILYVNMAGSGDFVVCWPLYYKQGSESLYQVSQRPLDVIRKIDPSLAVAPARGFNALHKVGTHIGMLLFSLGFQVTESLALLNDPKGFIDRFLKLLQDKPETAAAIDFFLGELASLRDYQRNDLVGTFINKFSMFSLDPVTRAMFGAATPTIDWKRVEDQNLVVLLDYRHEHDLERLRFKLLWVYSSFKEYVTRRGAGRHKPISLIIDEIGYLLSVNNFQSDLMADEIDEMINRLSRGYRVMLTLAHQELYQLSKRMQKSLMSLGTQIIGSTTDVESSRLLQERFSQFDPLRVKKQEAVFDRGAPTEYMRDIEYSYQEQLFMDSRRFLELPRFHFLVSRPGGEGATGNVLEEVNLEGYDFGHSIPDQAVAKLRNELAASSGRPVAEVLTEIDRRLNPWQQSSGDEGVQPSVVRKSKLRK